MEVSILSYWFAGDSSKIGEEIDATADILAHINEKRKNPSLADIDSILGGVKSNPDDNSVISGTALKVLFLNELSENFTKDAHSAWEQQFLYYINNLTVSLIQNQKSQCLTWIFLQLPSPLKIRPFATRSFGDIVGKTIGGDAQLLSVGFLVVFVYIVLVLGK